MAETVRTEQLTVLPEYQEKFLKDLLASTQLEQVSLHLYQNVRSQALAPGQQQAINLGYQGVGAYAPMLQAAEGTVGAGAGALRTRNWHSIKWCSFIDGSQLVRMIHKPINSLWIPYMESVIAQTQADIARQGDIQAQGIGAQAVRGGAFGGSRQAVAEQELGS
jgi:hypothetical protein